MIKGATVDFGRYHLRTNTGTTYAATPVNEQQQMSPAMVAAIEQLLTTINNPVEEADMPTIHDLLQDTNVEARERWYNAVMQMTGDASPLLADAVSIGNWFYAKPAIGQEITAGVTADETAEFVAGGATYGDVERLNQTWTAILGLLTTLDISAANAILTYLQGGLTDAELISALTTGAGNVSQRTETNLYQNIIGAR